MMEIDREKERKWSEQMKQAQKEREDLQAQQEQLRLHYETRLEQSRENESNLKITLHQQESVFYNFFLTV